MERDEDEEEALWVPQIHSCPDPILRVRQNMTSKIITISKFDRMRSQEMT
jgi:hypothetical protein